MSSIIRLVHLYQFAQNARGGRGETPPAPTTPPSFYQGITIRDGGLQHPLGGQGEGDCPGAKGPREGIPTPGEARRRVRYTPSLPSFSFILSPSPRFPPLSLSLGTCVIFWCVKPQDLKSHSQVNNSKKRCIQKAIEKEFLEFLLVKYCFVEKKNKNEK